MKKKLIGTTTLAALALVFGTSVALASDPASLIKNWDPDHDGTLDIHEVTSAATTQFGVLDPDNDGTLDVAEAAKAGIDKAELVAHDPDNDGTLDMNEYMTIVQKRFKAADADHSGTIDKAELMTPAGKALIKVALTSGPRSARP